MRAVIDLHCHLLFGIDDGPASLDESLALAAAAASAGIETIVATPHVSREYPNDAATIARGVEEVSAALRAQDVAIEVRRGAEVSMLMVEDLGAELDKLTLGDGGALLIESPFTALATGFDLMLMALQSRGHRIVLAHPERSPMFHRDPAMLASLVRAGVLTSVTAGSLAGRFGREVKRFSLWMAQEQMLHNVSSDAHNVTRRPPGVAAELHGAGLGPLGEWLVRTVPAAILAGAEIPPRPSVALPALRERGWRRWRGMLRRAW